MSEIKVNSIKGVGASAAAITINNTDGTCTANITNNLSNRRLTINGDMRIAQRGVSSTADGYLIDRFNVFDGSSLDESVTRAQVDVASGTTPYTLGFRKALKLTNGNQTSGAQADSNVQIRHKLEAQDIANSGWNYTSASSFITLSYWVKSSVAQNFYVYLKTTDGTGQRYAFETGSLTANTWTKVTNTIAGNSNLTFDNDNGEGLEINISPYWGTNYTDSGVSLNTWGAYASGTRTPDFATTWFTTNDATFEITGVQLEVGSHSTNFEFLSFGDELRRCQRYYQVLVEQTGLGTGANTKVVVMGVQYNGTVAYAVAQFPVTMRTDPSLDQNISSDIYLSIGNNGNNGGFDSFTLARPSPQTGELSWLSNRLQGGAVWVRTNGQNSKVAFQAEL